MRSAALITALLAVGCGGDVDSRMAEVRALQDVGQFHASINELREILVVDPDLPEASYRLGVALVQTGERSRAIWSLQKASESADYAVPAHSLLATVHLANYDYDEALRSIDRVLELEPERQAALELRAKANIGAKNFEDALSDTRHLVELFPDDYSSYALYATALVDAGDTEEAQRAHEHLKVLGAEMGDPDMAARGCLAPALFADDQLKDVDKAAALYQECADEFPTKGFVLSAAAKFFDTNGRTDESTELYRKAIELAPENSGLRSGLANRLLEQRRGAEAEAVLVEATETLGSIQSWSQLANFYRRTNQPQLALDALDKVRELAGSPSDSVEFTRADLLVDLGELDQAEEIAEQLNRETYATLINGRILLERQDPVGALKAFEAGIRNWPNNAPARFLAGLAAQENGDFERAIQEFREAIRVEKDGTDAAIVLAELHFERGEYDSALSFADSFIKNRPGSTQHHVALILAARSLIALKQYPQARASMKVLSKLPGQETNVAVYTAHIERAENGPHAAAEFILDSGIELKSAENDQVLRVLADNLVERGQPQEALAHIEKALESRPDSAGLYELKATALARMGERESAIAAFKKATEIDSSHAAAYGGLATLSAIDGRTDEAIDLFDRASELSPDSVEYSYSASQLSLASGDLSGAEQRLKEVVKRSAQHARARNDLAWILTEKEGDLDLALTLSNQARSLDPSANNLDTLGWIHLKRGEPEEAVRILENAVNLEPESASIRYHLALALGETGNKERAREMLQLALEAGAFPEFDDARRELERYGQL
ncbi:tetratricopeptide repeat protein [Myxococcota bacterium]|nr:tetratricopeptide repeat protein [Myxococcota bacterium]